MAVQTSDQALAAITDQGLFERLATAVLREADPIYHSLVHQGVNVAGKTVKSPLDGICFERGANPPHMVAVHHTTAARKDLEKKWLHDPSTVRPRKGSRPTAPPGDLVKTSNVVAEERLRTPSLKATLVLTTNEEPDEALVRTVQAAGRGQGLEIDLWSRSRLTHFLDNQPRGQWIRRSFLGIEQEQLSYELLGELSKKSLDIHSPPDDPDAWIHRTLDAMLAESLHPDVTFLVARSGLGKSVACHRKLAAHVEGGGVGFVLPHAAVAASMTLEQAVTTTLRQLHPRLAEVSVSPMSLCSPERPLLLVVEDINRSGQSQILVEKLVGWTRESAPAGNGTLASWRLLCPLWPDALASLGDQVRKRIEGMIISAGAFTAGEGREAVLVRARMRGRAMTPLNAEAISRSLGHDPLLIALYDQSETPDPHQVIGQFVEGSISRLAAAATGCPAADYRSALRVLGGEMLANRQVELSWRDVRGWAGLKGEPLRLLANVAHQGELFRLVGASDDQRISFRHDRVRDWLLADAAAELDRRNLLTEEILGEPYFAEVMGAVLVSGEPSAGFLQRVAATNPLALFHALRLFGRDSGPRRESVLQAIDEWLDDPPTHDGCNVYLRREALAALAETDSPEVAAIVRRFRDRTPNGQLARLRNGDLLGGIELCSYMGPGVGARWRDIQIEHAKLTYGRHLTEKLCEFLERADLPSAARVGALRLAGHIGDADLALAIETCWCADDERNDHLADYLWAFAECCADDPARFLGPVCDAWAALPDYSDEEGYPSPRDRLAAHELRWAFQKWPPRYAVAYFVQRGLQEDLRSPITHMLHGVDHPKAVSFVVEQLAAIQRRLEGSDSFSPFVMTAKDDWRRAQEDHGRPMSTASRELLHRLWLDEKNDKHLRLQAFTFWAATRSPGDVDALRAPRLSDDLADQILEQRLIRRDREAIPAMIEKLEAEDRGYWWQYGRYLWSPELTKVLDQALGTRATSANLTWGEYLASDRFTHEMVMRLPVDEGERLLLKHWSHLRFRPHFVQTALYVSTRRLLEGARTAINEAPQPGKMLEHLASSFGIWMAGHPGLTREKQVVALAPYLHLLSPTDLEALCEACNVRGWYSLRRELLDEHRKPPFHEQVWTRERAVSELDKMLAEKRFVRIDLWIEHSMKTGVSWTEILATMTDWLHVRRSPEALHLVASAVRHRGTRTDMGALNTYEGAAGIETSQVIADTEFAVRRRSIR